MKRLLLLLGVILLSVGVVSATDVSCTDSDEGMKGMNFAVLGNITYTNITDDGILHLFIFNDTCQDKFYNLTYTTYNLSLWTDYICFNESGGQNASYCSTPCSEGYSKVNCGILFQNYTDSDGGNNSLVIGSINYTHIILSDRNKTLYVSPYNAVSNDYCRDGNLGEYEINSTYYKNNKYAYIFGLSAWTYGNNYLNNYFYRTVNCSLAHGSSYDCIDTNKGDFCGIPCTNSSVCGDYVCDTDVGACKNFCESTTTDCKAGRTCNVHTGKCKRVALALAPEEERGFFEKLWNFITGA